MGAVANQQIQDLLLEVSDDLADLEAKTDQILVNMRIFNQEREADRRQLAEARTVLVQQRPFLQ